MRESLHFKGCAPTYNEFCFLQGLQRDHHAFPGHCLRGIDRHGPAIYASSQPVEPAVRNVFVP
jgi:hypothetical protein